MSKTQAPDPAPLTIYISRMDAETLRSRGRCTLTAYTERVGNESNEVALTTIPAPEGALPDAMTYAAARSWAVTKEWCRGWDDARAALAEPAPQAPVALTNEQIEAWWRDIDGEASRLFIAMLIRFARAIEAAHGIPAPQTKEPTNDR